MIVGYVVKGADILDVSEGVAFGVAEVEQYSKGVIGLLGQLHGVGKSRGLISL